MVGPGVVGPVFVFDPEVKVVFELSVGEFASVLPLLPLLSVCLKRTKWSTTSASPFVRPPRKTRSRGVAQAGVALVVGVRWGVVCAGRAWLSFADVFCIVNFQTHFECCDEALWVPVFGEDPWLRNAFDVLVGEVVL